MTEYLCALIVEDDAHSLMAISSMFNEMGIKFKRNTTGADVIQQALTMNPRPNFILLDLDLPQGDPFEICNMLRSDDDLANIPVIAITDQTVEYLLSQVKGVEFSACLPKPLPRKQFGMLLQEIMAAEALLQVHA